MAIMSYQMSNPQMQGFSLVLTCVSVFLTFSHVYSILVAQKTHHVSTSCLVSHLTEQSLKVKGCRMKLENHYKSGLRRQVYIDFSCRDMTRNSTWRNNFHCLPLEGKLRKTASRTLRVRLWQTE